MSEEEGKDPLVGRVLDGRYRIERLLGMGGMGRVYAAVQVELGRRVALKVLARELTGEAVYLERFRREAVAAAILGSPHIVDVTDFGMQDGEPPFLVMELLSGESLMDVLTRDGKLEVRRAVRIAVQLLDALADAHDAGIVHRDLKPANVFLVSLAGGDEMVKLLDFGIAKLHEAPGAQRLTAAGSLVGTPRFAAPEQLRGDGVDARTDVYGAGTVLYGMLTGRPPFPGPLEDLIRSVLEDEPPDVRVINPAVDPALADVVRRAMSKKKEDRFESADAMLRALGGTRASAPRAPSASEEAANAKRASEAEAKRASTERASSPEAESNERAGAKRSSSSPRAPQAEPGEAARGSSPADAQLDRSKRARRSSKPRWLLWSALLVLGVTLGGATAVGVYELASSRGERRAPVRADAPPAGVIARTPQCEGYVAAACECDIPERERVCEQARVAVAQMRANVEEDPDQAEGVDSWCHDAKRSNALCELVTEDPDEPPPPAATLTPGTRSLALREDAWLRPDGTRADRLTIPLTAGERVRLRMTSTAFDPALVLRSPSGRLLAANDDDPAAVTGTDAHIEYLARRAGEYVVEAGSTLEDAAGPYTLVRE